MGRVIARPFTGTWPDFVRTAGRHDFSVHPPKDTMLTYIQKAGMDVLSVGKIIDILPERGLQRHSVRSATGTELKIACIYGKRFYRTLFCESCGF